MTAERWLRISIPLQGLLILSQLLTGLNASRIPFHTYVLVHVGGGFLLVLLIGVHLLINWDWVRARYLRRGK